jgi:hypothetical protein
MRHCSADSKIESRIETRRTRYGWKGSAIVARTVCALFCGPVKGYPSDNIPSAPATARDRLRANAQKLGFVTAEGSSEVDVFIRDDRIVHVRYGADDQIATMVVNSLETVRLPEQGPQR